MCKSSYWISDPIFDRRTITRERPCGSSLTLSLLVYPTADSSKTREATRSLKARAINFIQFTYWFVRLFLLLQVSCQSALIVDSRYCVGEPCFAVSFSNVIIVVCNFMSNSDTWAAKAANLQFSHEQIGLIDMSRSGERKQLIPRILLVFSTSKKNQDQFFVCWEIYSVGPKTISEVTVSQRHLSCGSQKSQVSRKNSNKVRLYLFCMNL